MPLSARNALRASVAVVFAAFLSPLSAIAQSLEDNITQISGSGSAFTGLTHTRTAEADGTAAETEGSVGLSGSLGGQLESGARSLSLQYRGVVETERKTSPGEQADSSSVTGAARFIHADPGSRFDFNLGHTVSSVRNNTGFVVNPSDYDTQNTLSAGAGLRFFPGDLTTLRFSGQAGKSFGNGSLNDQDSQTVSSELSRRLGNRTTGRLVGSRTWSNDNEIDITTDSAQLQFEQRLENGAFSAGLGGSRADTELPGGSVNESEAVTGFLERTWVGDRARTTFGYNRELSDSAIDLSLNVPDDIDFLPDTVRITDLVIRDSFFVSHNTSRLCSACNLGVAMDAAMLESEVTGATTHEYTGSLNFGFQLTNLQRLNFIYVWQGDAGEDPDIINDQIHRFNTSWTRQLTEQTSFSVQLNQSYLRSRLAGSDQEQFTLRLLLTKGFSLMGRPE